MILSLFFVIFSFSFFLVLPQSLCLIRGPTILEWLEERKWESKPKEDVCKRCYRIRMYKIYVYITGCF